MFHLSLIIRVYGFCRHEFQNLNSQSLEFFFIVILSNCKLGIVNLHTSLSKSSLSTDEKISHHIHYLRIMGFILISSKALKTAGSKCISRWIEGK